MEDILVAYPKMNTRLIALLNVDAYLENEPGMVDDPPTALPTRASQNVTRELNVSVRDHVLTPMEHLHELNAYRLVQIVGNPVDEGRGSVVQVSQILRMASGCCNRASGSGMAAAVQSSIKEDAVSWTMSETTRSATTIPIDTQTRIIAIAVRRRTLDTGRCKNHGLGLASPSCQS